VLTEKDENGIIPLVIAVHATRQVAEKE